MEFQKDLQIFNPKAAFSTNICNLILYTLLCSCGQIIKYRPDITTANQLLLMHYFITRLERSFCSRICSNTRLR